LASPSLGGCEQPTTALPCRRDHGRSQGTWRRPPGYFTRLVMDAPLLARFGSAVAAGTLTVLVIELFFAITVTRIWIGWLAALASELRLQLTTPKRLSRGQYRNPG
jgi:hypothetical protein